MNCEESNRYSFNLYNRHIEFLDRINNTNRSNALQTVLDSIINNDEKIKKKYIIDKTIQYGVYGGIFLLISYLFILPLQLISICIGTFIFAYGMLGGVRYSLSRANYKR